MAWTDVLEFEDDGRLVIKDPTLKEELSRRMGSAGYVAIDFNPKCPTNFTCPIPGPGDARCPDLCICLVRVDARLPVVDPVVPTDPADPSV